MRKTTWASVIIGAGVCLIVGLVLDLVGVWSHRTSLGVHLIVQISAGIIATLLAAWLFDRRTTT